MTEGQGPFTRPRGRGLPCIACRAGRAPCSDPSLEPIAAEGAELGDAGSAPVRDRGRLFRRRAGTILSIAETFPGTPRSS